MINPDFIISNHGSIFTIEPQNDNAAAFLSENVEAEGWQWLGRSLAVDHHNIEYLANALYGAGFALE